jgi:hypothetical protein
MENGSSWIGVPIGKTESGHWTSSSRNTTNTRFSKSYNGQGHCHYWTLRHTRRICTIAATLQLCQIIIHVFTEVIYIYVLLEEHWNPDSGPKAY